MRGAAGARISSRSRRRRLWDVPLGHPRAKGRSEPRRARRSRRIPVDLASGVAGPQSCRVFSRWCVRARRAAGRSRTSRACSDLRPARSLPQICLAKVVSTMRLTTAACRSCKCTRGAPPRFPPPRAPKRRVHRVGPPPRWFERRARPGTPRTRVRNPSGSNIATIRARRARPRGLSRLERARGAPRASRASPSTLTSEHFFVHRPCPLPALSPRSPRSPQRLSPPSLSHKTGSPRMAPRTAR